MTQLSARTRLPGSPASHPTDAARGASCPPPASLGCLLDRAGRAVVMALVALALVGCATLSPGEDAIVVRVEQSLQVALPIYDAGMEFYFKNHQTLPAGTKEALEKVRVGFPRAYRATDSALQVYKAGKGGDLLASYDEMQRLVVELVALVRAIGGPDLLKGVTP